MDFQDLLSSLADRFQKNLADSDKTISDSTAQTADRLQMGMNPDLQGPHQSDEPSEADNKMTDMVVHSLPMVGSITTELPGIVGMIGKAAPEVESAVVPASKYALAKQVADDASRAAVQGEVNQPTMAMAQNALSRAADQSARYAAQLKAAKQAALAKFRGSL